MARRARRRGLVRRWTIPVIGGITPVGLMVVNVAAFIVHHLAEFRLGITVCAFVSGLLLGSYQALIAYRVMKRRIPEADLVSESNEEMVLVVGMLAVIIFSGVTALLCWLGLSSEKNLPNAMTFVGGAIGIAIPIVSQIYYRRTLHEKDAELKL
jgi:hypothetical protein